MLSQRSFTDVFSCSSNLALVRRGSGVTACQFHACLLRSWVGSSCLVGCHQELAAYIVRCSSLHVLVRSRKGQRHHAFFQQHEWAHHGWHVQTTRGPCALNLPKALAAAVCLVARQRQCLLFCGCSVPCFAGAVCLVARQRQCPLFAAVVFFVLWLQCVLSRGCGSVPCFAGAASLVFRRQCPLFCGGSSLIVRQRQCLLFCPGRFFSWLQLVFSRGNGFVPCFMAAVSSVSWLQCHLFCGSILFCRAAAAVSLLLRRRCLLWLQLELFRGCRRCR